MVVQHPRRCATWAARLPVALAATVLALPAEAQLCDEASAPIAADGRAFGHLPYGDTPESALVPLPGEMAERACLIRAEALPDLSRLIAASGGRLRALSCHRSIARQRDVFCRERGTPEAERAESVAPPGYSEHATGYALDFAFRPRANGCPDAEACVAATEAFRWLAANARRYGFEMSFPAGNGQRVKWEPWHWRWVGTTEKAPGAAAARFTFARARRDYPAQPGVDPVVRARKVRAPVWLGALTPPSCDKRGRCKVAKPKKR